MLTQPLWQPSRTRQEQSNLSQFMKQVASLTGTRYNSYQDILKFSVSEMGQFWTLLWDFCQIKASHRGSIALERESDMPGARFFPDALLNYAENLLQREDDEPALIFWGEDQVKLRWSWLELHQRVAQAHHAFKSEGLVAGDRICAVVPNHPETIVLFLAAASLGIVWSSCSPDFGERGIVDRFGQIAPKLLIVCDGYYYAGKTHLMGGKMAQVLRQIPSLRKTVVIDYVGQAQELARALPQAVTQAAFVEGKPKTGIDFVQLPFDHPLYILYSSGTTGIPKCIVHRAGGILLKHLSELALNTDVKRGERLFYFTTCGWMMWNWMVSGLALGATLVLYDGSPFYPNERALFDMVEKEQVNFFGTSAKFIDEVRKSGWQPKETYSLLSLQAILSTGSPLAAENFDFVYQAIKRDVHLASISGGTDICGCFVGGNPISPVWAGEIQGPMLGMAVDVFDEMGKPQASGKGELVCDRPFPSMPIGFWNDPTGEKYQQAYFSRFPNVWCHGDFAEITEHHGLVILGRSDATLNPGGVRIGTAELYAQVEKLGQVREAVAIGQDWLGDVRIVLFVRLGEGVILDDALRDIIKKAIRSGASPRHVPAVIVQVSDIPRTKSGKITELAVRDVVHGREIKNKEALANPEALELFRNLPELDA